MESEQGVGGDRVICDRYETRKIISLPNTRATAARGLKLSDESRHSPHSEWYNRRALNLGELW